MVNEFANGKYLQVEELPRFVYKTLTHQAELKFYFAQIWFFFASLHYNIYLLQIGLHFKANAPYFMSNLPFHLSLCQNNEHFIP